MLDTIEIDGFRSLLNFRMDLRPGLNILVGANGTGKSNLISFLDFLASLIDGDLNSAIAGAHGAGSVFSKERFVGTESANMSFSVHGTLTPIDPDALEYYVPDADRLRHLSGTYSYACNISYLSSIPAVFISREEVSIETVDEGKIRLVRTTEHVGGSFETRVQMQPDDHKINRTIFRYLRRNDQRIAVSEYLAARVTPQRSLLHYVGPEASGFIFMMMELSSYRSVNIDPAVARKPTPVGSLVALGANGEGLAGALYQLKNGTYFPSRQARRFGPRRTAGSETFQSIISWCREVNPEIRSVTVELDPMEAQLRPYMYFSMAGRSEGFPFSRISDGTVKWLTLATVLFAEQNLNLIEEPENFLHPFMQESFVALCRQAIQRSPGRVILISTHSPTLLDCCSPDELTMFELEEGESRASRVANREQLAKKIENSRFGVGYYYRIGALYGEDRSDS